MVEPLAVGRELDLVSDFQRQVSGIGRAVPTILFRLTAVVCP
jgi:hypothetical protein